MLLDLDLKNLRIRRKILVKKIPIKFKIPDRLKNSIIRFFFKSWRWEVSEFFLYIRSIFLFSSEKIKFAWLNEILNF
ncbi:unnamed protein product [Blepharisma stoltei]|uniref:Uncharacterized protein n=1 Tax=Blepharisma stoltei TaxID=1481888 RepID=A0AAU9JEV4_9CILI|nr:unnamed protein product [Blepharisma stoltei]